MAPQTRAQAQRVVGRRSQGQQNRRRREALERQQAAQLANPTSPISGNSLISYDLLSLAPEARDIAARGLRADNLIVDTVRMFDPADSGTYVAIGIFEKKPSRIHIYGPESRGRKVKCNCEAFSKRPETAICEHIYWLYDGLNDAIAEVSDETVQALDRNSVEQRFSELFRQIVLKIHRLPDDLNRIWDYSEDTDETLKDILAVFDPDKLWDELDEDFDSEVPASEDESFQDLVVRGDLPLTVFSLARHDPIFRDRLQQAVSKDICAEDFILKLDDRRKKSLQLLDNYERSGPELRVRSVSTIASHLRDIVEKISEYKDGQRAPLNLSFDIGCSELLVRMLRDICTHNRDIYVESSWFQGTPPEAERDRNLFVNLIASPPSQHRGIFFILEFLSDELPPQSYSHLATHLESLLDQLQLQQAPNTYVQKLKELIDQFHTGGHGHDEPEQLESRFSQQPPVSPGQFRHTIPAEYATAQHASASTATPGPSRYARRPSEQDQPDPQRRRLG